MRALTNPSRCFQLWDKDFVSFSDIVVKNSESTTFWPLWWRVSLSIRLYTTLNHIRFVNLSYFHLYSSPSTGIISQWPTPRWLKSSVSRALHRCRRGHEWVRIPFRPELLLLLLFSGFNFTITWVVCITAMINLVLKIRHRAKIEPSENRFQTIYLHVRQKV